MTQTETLNSLIVSFPGNGIYRFVIEMHCSDFLIYCMYIVVKLISWFNIYFPFK